MPEHDGQAGCGRAVRIAVLVSGRGTNLAALLERFPPGGNPAVSVVIADRAGAAALDRARAAGVPALECAPVRDERPGAWGRRLLDLLRRHETDLVVLAGFLRRVPPEVVRAFRGRIVNVHPALLPRHGGKGMYGARVHAAVLAAGESESGATVHFVDERYDQGAVIARARVPVLPGDTVETLAARVLEQEHRLLPDVVARLAKGDISLKEDGTVEGGTVERAEAAAERAGAVRRAEGTGPGVDGRGDAAGERRTVRIRRALLSVSDKSGLVELARGLAAHGVELLSTGGTAAALREAGLEVREVSEETGFPEMLDGRVKTLHPRLFAGILARGGRSDDLEAIAAHGIRPIELVVVNLYPFESAAARAARLPDDALEQIDIGGPSLIRAAAKNFASVAVLCDPATYAAFLDELEAGAGSVGEAVRRDLAGRAFAHTAAYDLQVAAAFGASRPETLPEALVTGGRRRLELRYGENPHQRAAFYAEPPRPTGLAAATLLQGKALSFTNLLDLDAAWAVVDEVRRTIPPFPPGMRPASSSTSELLAGRTAVCAIVKHATPCGVGMGADAAEAYARARATDPVSAFGGVCVLTVPISAAMVEAAAEHFLEVLGAPAVDPEARESLARKPNLRVLELPHEGRAPAWDAKRVAGGLLVQEADRLPPLAPASLQAVTGELTPELRESLALAWAVVKHVKSNAIVFGDQTGTLGIGAGQMSRVDAVELAVRKAAAAGHSLAGSAVASDAFFPFRDGLDAAAVAGAAGVIQPGGSKRDGEVIAAAAEHGIALVHTGTRHFRH